MGTSFLPQGSDPRYDDDNRYLMRRSLIAALLSAVVGSIAAFLILKRWELIGTLAGAALFPSVYTLVSHWSNKGLDQTITVLRKRRGQQLAPSEEEQLPAPSRPDVPEPPSRRQLVVPALTRWLSVGLACVALGFGIYAMFLESSTERVILRERVIEREVASAVQPISVSKEPDAPRPETDPTTTTSTVSTTSTTDETAPATESSSPTATGPADTTDAGGSTGDVTPGELGESVATVSTTGIEVGSQTTYASTQTAP